MPESFSWNRRSRSITEGVQRTPNRAMLRAVGFGDGDFSKPIVGVANAHSNMTPCNVGLNGLADAAMAALTEALGCIPVLHPSPRSQELHQKLDGKCPHDEAEPGLDHSGVELHAEPCPEISTDENGNAGRRNQGEVECMRCRMA